MATDTTESPSVEVLSRLLARRTEPGWSHVIWSEAELGERLRRELAGMLAPGDDLELAIRALLNELVHEPVYTRSEYSRQQTLLSALARGGEFGSSELQTMLEAWRTTVTRRRYDSVAVLEIVESVTNAFLEELTTNADAVGKLDEEEAARLGQRAAERVLAAARWSQVVGDRLDTTQVTRLLGITRQALAKRQKAGSLLGLAGDGTTWYPTWQFDSDAASIRPEVRDVIGAFRDRLDDVDPLIIAAWASTPQDEDLAGDTPADWLRAGRDPDQLRRAAERAAARLAR